jgi:hypothetical protein
MRSIQAILSSLIAAHTIFDSLPIVDLGYELYRASTFNVSILYVEVRCLLLTSFALANYRLLHLFQC